MNTVLVWTSHYFTPQFRCVRFSAV